jgi:hypothetical protein
VPKERFDILQSETSFLSPRADRMSEAVPAMVRPLCDPSLSFKTCLIMRRDDDSRIVNEFARARSFACMFEISDWDGKWSCYLREE